MYELFQRCPDIYLPPIKEVNYFGVFERRFSENGWSIREYERLFIGAGQQKYICEITPVYLTHPGSAESIYDYNPGMKIIITIREPLDRVFSQFKHHKDRIKERDFGNYISEGIRSVEEGLVPARDWFSPAKNVSQSLYAESVRRYLRLFGSENVCVLVYEDLRDKPQHWVQSLRSFLGVSLPEPVASEKVNASQNELLPLSEVAQKKVRMFFQRDVEMTSALIGIDLTARWYGNRRINEL